MCRYKVDVSKVDFSCIIQLKIFKYASLEESQLIKMLGVWGKSSNFAAAFDVGA